MKRTLTTAAVAALVWLSPATPASAQDAAVTAATAELERTWRPGDPSWQQPDLPAVAILRQASGPRPEAELDALADRLAAMAADATLPEHVRTNARLALTGAADFDSSLAGTPYARGFDLLLHLYEGGADNVLRTIFWVDPERGPAYVREVFERSERPTLCPVMHGSASVTRGDTTWADDGSGSWAVWDPPPECVRGSRTFHKTTWCKAGEILYDEIVGDAMRRMWPGGGIRTTTHQPTPVPDGLPEHVEDWYRRCR